MKIMRRKELKKKGKRCDGTVAEILMHGNGVFFFCQMKINYWDFRKRLSSWNNG